MPHQLIARHSSGKIIDVRDAQNGLACDCSCAVCGDRLMAKQGEINAWHFAHSSGNECAGALESAIHLAAKQIIAQEKSVALPPCSVGANIRTDRFDASYPDEMLNRLELSREKCSIDRLKLRQCNFFSVKVSRRFHRDDAISLSS